ncbi:MULTISPECIES: phosphopentomutase [Kosmotoga]|jgi:phosphopentomutase|uniref:Phosphopentomutase n=1 Tax=Kosmotoga olearia (strain ATCC BAA-1733 / DSM 21960 / TBF 19.5.1) TaxID=521045 RepID=DEOB_KOSOT|nr:MULTISPECIES: phosphopentomutase [Kosmotoga]C5CHD5.1 RecName: Full=Phosphopentomutase; AltName: Full=Phosphodeoxyribomutase [Kosmotoga olearia TBF 19.5.1]ACR78774.1 phosphopentomutase [Kosmotoga olearia TBF 19.5.1]MDI3524128.1 phosphopentomutase [Kosmotoga sp.]MDK2952623.1 phosphopentomutase [Kosmotoga sp.]OAA23049.1 phosphopentomutase [Kosmotoga sp. DU53]
MRAIIIVLDSAGIGEMPDAEKYGDKGSNTFGNTAKAVGGLHMPNSQRLGLGNLTDILGVPPTDHALGAYGRMLEKSPGKDTTTGHWEFMGIILEKPFDMFPNGFPPEIIEPFEKETGRKVIGNKPASGTEIIKELGREHEKTGALIVYTSADSVFQIAAHEEIVPVPELYKYCEIARKILNESGYKVARVIARPFIGEWPNYTRTPRRHDYSLPPEGKIALEYLVENGVPVYAVGKINDIYDGHGITEYVKTKDNMDGVDKTLDYIRKVDKGLIFTNLVDFDMKYGHRNNPEGYAKALEEFDARLPEIIGTMRPDDVLFITADHGCDPTTPSTDHSREKVPLLVYGRHVKENVFLGERETFADLGQTILDLFGVEPMENGTSFKKEILD